MTPPIELFQPIAASPAAIWHACSTPTGLAGWQADRVRGESSQGGQLELEWPALGAIVELEVVDRQELQRIVLADERTTLELTVRGSGLALRHDGITAEDHRRGSLEGWRSALALLAHSLETHPGRQRRTRWHVAEAQTTPEAVHAAMLTLLAGPVGPAPTAAGAPVAVRLGHSGRLSGRLLHDPLSRDVTLTWKEQDDSVIAVRCLPTPDHPDQRLVTLVWSRWDATPGPKPDAERALQRLFDALLGRLAGMGSA